jgi:hypothetical protein
MVNPPSCLAGNLPNNLDIDFKDVIPTANGLAGYPGAAQAFNPSTVEGQVDMNKLGVLQTG